MLFPLKSSLVPRDPLLNLAGIILWGVYGLLLVAIVLVAVGLGVGLTAGRDEQMANLAAAGFGGSGFVMLVLGTALVGGLLILALKFTRSLLGIIDSVGEGDPFVAANADRLATMGLLTAGGELILVSLSGIALWFGGGEQRLIAEKAAGLLPGGLILMLILFILARVFRLGTRMRDDLEGTV